MWGEERFISRINLTSLTMEIDITKMTSKGQIVIPQGIRERKHIGEGERFIDYDSDDSIVLKRVKNLESVKDIKKFESVFSSMWATAKERKVSEEDVKKEIEAHRKEKNAKANS